MKKNKNKSAKNEVVDIVLIEAQEISIANIESRETLVARAKAAKEAALMGLISQEEADRHWAIAIAACEPSQESLDNAKAAKEAKAHSEKVFKTAESAFVLGLIDAAALDKAQVDMVTARTAYDAALKAARGFSMGGGGSRYKGQMSGLDAAFLILSESDVPLNAGAITKAAMERGLWMPDGLTPIATLSGALQMDVKKGDKARFVKVDTGLYTIRR
jgi:hypothetical protein